MGIVTKSIGTSSRDYSTLQAWADLLPADLVADTNSQVGECYNDSEFSGAGTLLTLSGQTTNSTYTITLKTATGQGFKDHADVQTNALSYNQSYGVGIRTTSGAYSTTLAVTTANVFISNLQIKNAQYVGIATSGQVAIFTGCLFDSNYHLGSVMCKGLSFLNCLFLLSNSGCCIRNSVTITVANCTFIDLVGNGTGVNPDYATANVTNCAFFGPFTHNFAPYFGTVNYKNCVTDKAGWTGGGVNGTFNDQGSNLVSKTFANQFVSTTTDFKLKTGADCLDVGFTDTADIPAANDIVGTARPQSSAWDVGCWELVVASSANPRFGDFFFAGP